MQITRYMIGFYSGFCYGFWIFVLAIPLYTQHFVCKYLLHRKSWLEKIDKRIR